MTSRPVVSDLLTGVLASGSILIAGVALYRTFANTNEPSHLRPSPTPEWSELVRIASWPGQKVPSSESHVALVFVGMGCEECKHVPRLLDSLLTPRGVDLAIGYLHYPLPASFPGAFEASVGAECAVRTGKLSVYLERLYNAHSLTSLRDNVTDLTAPGMSYSSCSSDPRSIQVVERHIVAGRQIGVTRTPTILIDGYLIGVPATPRAVDSVARLALRLK